MFGSLVHHLCVLFLSIGHSFILVPSRKQISIVLPAFLLNTYRQTNKSQTPQGFTPSLCCSVHFLSAGQHCLLEEGEHEEDPRSLSPLALGEVIGHNVIWEKANKATLSIFHTDFIQCQLQMLPTSSIRKASKVIGLWLQSSKDHNKRQQMCWGEKKEPSPPCCMVDGRTFSPADSDTKNAKGITHRHTVKYASTLMPNRNKDKI